MARWWAWHWSDLWLFMSPTSARDSAWAYPTIQRTLRMTELHRHPCQASPKTLSWKWLWMKEKDFFALPQSLLLWGGIAGPSQGFESFSMWIPSFADLKNIIRRDEIQKLEKTGLKGKPSYFLYMYRHIFRTVNPKLDVTIRELWERPSFFLCWSEKSDQLNQAIQNTAQTCIFWMSSGIQMRFLLFPAAESEQKFKNRMRTC